jgi:hypothetical protein
MLKLSTSFSKKVPVPDQDFSSQNYHASIELELSDALTPEQVQERIHQTFEMVRSAVEAELTGKLQVAAVPVVAQTVNPVRGEPPVKASNKQVKFITDLATSQGFKLSDLNAHVQKLYGVTGLYDLTRQQASTLLDSLQDKRKAA